jgi:hypothetical protein
MYSFVEQAFARAIQLQGLQGDPAMQQYLNFKSYFELNMRRFLPILSACVEVFD